MNAKTERLLLAAAIVLGIVVVGGLVRAADEKEKNEPAKADNPFADKIMLVHMDAEMEVLTGILTGLEIREIHGRKFLVGVGVPTGDPKTGGSAARCSSRGRRSPATCCCRKKSSTNISTL